MKQFMVNLVRVCVATAAAMCVFTASASAQNCGTGGGGNQTKFYTGSGPLTRTTPAVTAADYAATVSQPSSTITLIGCCAQPGGSSNCKATIALGAPGVPNLVAASWRLTGISGLRCAPASPAIAPNVDYPLTVSPKEVFQMSDPSNNSSFCTATIQIRGTGLSYTSYTSPNTYTRNVNFGIAK